MKDILNEIAQEFIKYSKSINKDRFCFCDEEKDWYRLVFLDLNGNLNCIYIDINSVDVRYEYQYKELFDDFLNNYKIKYLFNVIINKQAENNAE